MENNNNNNNKGTYTIKEILEREPKRAEDSPEYRKAVRATNEKIREYELSQARMYAEADKYVSMSFSSIVRKNGKVLSRKPKKKKVF